MSGYLNYLFFITFLYIKKAIKYKNIIMIDDNSIVINILFLESKIITNTILVIILKSIVKKENIFVVFLLKKFFMFSIVILF